MSASTHCTKGLAESLGSEGRAAAVSRSGPNQPRGEEEEARRVRLELGVDDLEGKVLARRQTSSLLHWCGPQNISSRVAAAMLPLLLLVAPAEPGHHSMSHGRRLKAEWPGEPTWQARAVWDVAMARSLYARAFGHHFEQLLLFAEGLLFAGGERPATTARDLG